MRPILPFASADHGDVRCFTASSLMTFFSLRDLLCDEFATGLFLETHSIAGKGFRSRNNANLGRVGVGTSGSAPALRLGFKVDMRAG